MAVSIFRISGASDYVAGTRREHTRTIGLTGSYPTGGETITAKSVGLKRIERVVLGSNAAEVDLTGAWVTAVTYQTDGSIKLALFESSAAGGVFTQKPAEAYESTSGLRATFIGIA